MRDRRPRVVFDYMIFLQAAARHASPAGVCLSLAEEGLIALCVCPEILAEIKDVLNRPQIQAKFQQLRDEVICEFIARIDAISVHFDKVERFVSLARDPKDEIYLNLAIQAEAQYLVSRDRDLLEGAQPLAESMLELRMLDPIQFLAAFRESFQAAPRTKE